MEDQIPRMRHIPLKPTTNGTESCVSIVDKVRLAMKGLEGLFPSLTTQSVEPTIDHFWQIDWSVSLDSLPNKAKELLELIVTECHPSTLQWLLTIARRRIFSDFQLWNLHRDMERMFKIGDLIYCRKKVVGESEDMISGEF